MKSPALRGLVAIGVGVACIGVFLAWHEPSLMLSLITVIPGCGL
jgi:hypothetical protein